MKQFRYDDTTIVTTKAGKLQGYFFDGTYVFKGVHYAEAERFCAPTPVEPWEGVKDATSYGMVCPLMHQDRPMGELMVPHAYWPQDAVVPTAEPPYSTHCKPLEKTVVPTAEAPVDTNCQPPEYIFVPLATAQGYRDWRPPETVVLIATPPEDTR